MENKLKDKYFRLGVIEGRKQIEQLNSNKIKKVKISQRDYIITEIVKWANKNKTRDNVSFKRLINILNIL